jgi:hypothetical protein
MLYVGLDCHGIATPGLIEPLHRLVERESAGIQIRIGLADVRVYEGNTLELEQRVSAHDFSAIADLMRKAVWRFLAADESRPTAELITAEAADPNGASADQRRIPLAVSSTAHGRT